MENVNNLEYVLVRTDRAGVHLGFLAKEENTNGGFSVTLLNSRRVWSWAGANSLSDLAIKGSKKASECKITAPVSKNRMVAIEIISVSDLAKENLDSIPEWTF